MKALHAMTVTVAVTISQQGSLLGPRYSNESIGAFLAEMGAATERFPLEADLLDCVAGLLAEGKIVGWFHGRMEFGPRALGARSIIGYPRNPAMQAAMNLKIKFRESFRPFAPSVLEEKSGEWFATGYPSPYMILVFDVRPEKRAIVPAITLVDGTGRLQSVARDENPLFHALITRFERLSGLPVLLNTSFIENEPIVEHPAQAIDCFLRTKMDALALGPFFCRKAAPESGACHRHGLRGRAHHVHPLGHHGCGFHGVFQAPEHPRFKRRRGHLFGHYGGNGLGQERASSGSTSGLTSP